MDTNTEELWKFIDKFDGFEVSNKGRIRRSRYTITYPNGKIVEVPEQEIHTTECYDGLYANFNRNHIHMKKLVADAFLPRPDDWSTKNYILEFIDGNMYNCSVDNLRYVTLSDHIKQQIDEGRRNSPNNYRGVQIVCQETGREYASIKELCDAIGVSRYFVTRNLYSGTPILGNHYSVL